MNLASMNRYKYMINQNTGQCSQSEETYCCEGQKKCLCFEWHLVLWLKSEREGLCLCCAFAAKMWRQVRAKRVEQRKAVAKSHNVKLKPLLPSSIFACLRDYTQNLPLLLLENFNCFLTVDRCKETVPLNHSHLVHLTLKSTKRVCFLNSCVIHTSLRLSVSLLAFAQPSEPM